MEQTSENGHSASICGDPCVSKVVPISEGTEACEGEPDDIISSEAVDFDVECWDDVKKEESRPHRTPCGKAIPSLDAISVNGDRLALSVSSLVGRYWSGMILLAEIGDASSNSKIVTVKNSCTVPSGVSDVQVFGDSNIFAGHDDGCVSVLCPDESDTQVSDPRRLQVTSYAVEHDSFVIRVGLTPTNDGGASLENDGRIKLWMLDPFMSVSSFKAYPFRAFDMAFHPKRKELLATCGDIHSTAGDGTSLSAHNSLSLWSISERSTATVASSVSGVKCSDFGAAFTSISWSPVDDDWLFAGDRVGNISLFDIRKLCDPVVTMHSVHKNGPILRIVSDGSHVFSLGSDRRLAVREIYADDDGLARDRVVFGDGFKHSSGLRGMSVNANGDVWTSENTSQLWCHQLPVDGSTKKLNSTVCNFIPDLKNLEF